MKKEIVLGDEALALGAVDAGISCAFAYPGTPSTEIAEFLISGQKEFGIRAEWCANEKTAFEAALGASFAGKRALVSMKHVGLNVAADAFMNSAISGVKGGLVVAVADDPGMHSSQNEQDSRYYADFAKILCLEPCNAQEAYDFTRKAFALSEELGIPVMVRLVTRIAHTREEIERGEKRGQNALDEKMKWNEWVLLPLNARVQFRKLLEKKPLLLEKSGEFVESGKGKGKRGVICAGNAFNYFMEAGSGIPCLKISSYPLPEEKIREFIAGLDEIVVLEDGYPFIEEKLAGMFGLQGKKVLGKLSGLIPKDGELTPESVKKALGIRARIPFSVEKEFLAGRPPQPCKGCPHSDLYRALNEAVKEFPGAMVFGDIGCYTLGALKPFLSINTCIEMGSSVNMSRGASVAGARHSIGVIGDSTFVHGGMPALAEAAKRKSNITLIVLDNSTVAMTGGQETIAQGEELVRICEGLGIEKEHVKVIEPLPGKHRENAEVLKGEISYNGASVVISKRACIQILKRLAKKK